MRRVLFILAGVLALGDALHGQTSKSDLEHLYGRATDRAFTAGPGVTVRAYFDSTDLVCGLVISGATSERSVIHIFDLLVPKTDRGFKGLEMVDCAGRCMRMMDYEKVALASGVLDHLQTSNPSAIITYKRPECKHASEELRKIAMKITSAKW